MSNFVKIILLLLLLSSCGPSIIDGYTDKTSYSSEDSISIYLNANKTSRDYPIELTDINGKFVQTIKADVSPQTITNDNPFENGYGYKCTAKSKVPNLKSGIYLIEEKIPFIIKPKKQYDILILYSSNTENAYCESGGKSTYAYNSSDNLPAAIVSFRRPIGLPFHSTEFLKWIDTQHHGIGYICDKDLDDYKNIASAKLLIIPGHSEYWTRKARINFDRFIDNGKNALILSGNTMWWQVRYDENQMICYKNLKKDPVKDSKLKTINWTHSSLELPSINSVGLDFERGGFGKNEDQGWDGFKIVNPTSPLLQGTNLKKGDLIQLPSDEYDGAPLKFYSDSSKVTLENPFNFYRYELIGYDIASRKPKSNGAWIAMKKNRTSGIIINTGSTDWCKKEGMEGASSNVIKKITLNMIDLLLANDENKIFTNR